jgi:glycosyltransferase involved in cell wall biosynthesis
MKNADLFLMSSFHEAAPMVIDEALCLDLPVLTVRTTSSREMVTLRQGGWVCENTGEALTEMLIRVLSTPGELSAVRAGLAGHYENNDAAMEQFAELIEG